MGFLNIGGKRVKVDDTFLSLSPEQQQQTVEEIAASIGDAPAAAPTANTAVGGDAAVGVADVAAPGNQERYDKALANVRSKYYGGMDDAKWAEYSAKAFAPYDNSDLLREGMTFGFQDEVGALSGALGNPLDFGNRWNDYQELYASRRELGKEKAGLGGTGLEILGAVAGGRPDTAVAKGGTLLGKMFEGAKAGAGQGAAYGFGSTDGGLVERSQGALKGGSLGATAGVVAPAVGGWLAKGATNRAQTKATNAAIKGAPSAAELKASGANLFQQLDQQGVAVKPDRFGQLAMDLAAEFKKMRANPKLDPKATATLDDLIRAAIDAKKNGTGLTLSELHTFRQIAQKAAQSSEGRDQMFSSRIIQGIDDMIASLKPADMLGGADPKQATKLLFDAIGTWSRSMRVGVIEEAVYRAQNTASGFENGLRIEFRKLLQNKGTRSSFTAAELQAIEDVARGGPIRDVAKFLGKFGWSPNNMLGASIGGTLGSVAMGDITGGLGLMAIGTASRKASEVMTNKAAERAAKVVGTQGIPIVPQMDPALLEQLTRGAIGRGGQPVIPR